MGVATGCGFKEIYRFPHTTYPYSSCICTFWQQHPYFCFHFVKMILRSCSSTFFKLHFRYLKKKTQYKHIPATTGIPRHPYEGCTYCFIREEAHTNVRFLSCDGHQLYERGVDLEVEGVRYIEMHRGPAAYVLGPASFKEQRSRTRRRSHCMPRRLRIRAPRFPRARYRVMAS